MIDEHSNPPRSPVLGSRADRAVVWAKGNPLNAAEVAGAVLITAYLLANVGPLWFGILGALGRGVLAFFQLLRVDGPETLRSGAAIAARFALLLAPGVRLFRTARPHRRFWLPVYAYLATFSLALVPLSVTNPPKWALLVALSALGWFAAGTRLLAWISLAPLVVALHPTALTHSGPTSDTFWRGRLADRCARNDGERPRGFRAEMANTHYYAATQLNAERLLVTGERRSWWLRRGPDGGFSIERRADIQGDLWQGSVGEHGELWFTHRGGGIVEMPPDATFGEHSQHDHRIDVHPDYRTEFDLLDAVYDPTTRSVFASEMVAGGIWELSLPGQTMRRHQVGGFYLQLVRRADGMLVGIDTARLFVFDPRRRQIVETLPAALGSAGLDVCQTTGDVAVADYAGRVRLFRRDAAGRYAFERGASLPAPRRVAFSPDCAHLAVTSADDETVLVLRRRDLAVVRTYRVGPGLRDVLYLDPARFVVADACTLTFLRGDE